MRRMVGLFVLLGVLMACRSHPVDGKTSQAIGEVRTLIRALDEYRKDCAGFPSTLDRLLADPGEAKGCNGYGVISTADHLGALRREPTTRAEYEWSYRAVRPVVGRVPVVYQNFELTATWGGPDVRYSFWTSDAGTIHLARGRSATSRDEVVQ